MASSKPRILALSSAVKFTPGASISIKSIDGFGQRLAVIELAGVADFHTLNQQAADLCLGLDGADGGTQLIEA